MSASAPATGGSGDPRAAGPLGIICGGGVAPAAVADAVMAGGREVMLFAFKGIADPARIARFPHEWIALGQFGRFKRLAGRHGCRDFVWIGALSRPSLWQIRLDFGTLPMMPYLYRALRGGDNHTLTTLGEFFEHNGFRLLGVKDVAARMLAPRGVLTQRAPTDQDRSDIARGLDLLAAISRFDVGQAAVVAANHVLATEGIEGTDAMLARIADLRQSGRIKAPGGTGVAVKVAKRGQDKRLDLPVIGPDTVAAVARAGLGGLAIAAGETIVVDLDRVVADADRAGLFIIGVGPLGG